MKFFLYVSIFALLASACESTKIKGAPMESKKASGVEQLNGTWELNYISGPRIAFEGLYPDKKPQITFNAADTSFSGNTSCNNFRGRLDVDASSIHFPETMAMTRMMCPGEGENVFINTLKKINKYAISDSTLNLMMGDVAMMRFVKK
ncbi:MAG: META domain-containing protein [Agriterribacter sp.]